MAHNSLMVRNITHLTDARYFAAMEVDWMSIHLNTMPSSFSEWHTMKDWIEGVKFAAEIPADDEMLLAKTIIDAKPDGIILNQLTFPDVPQSIQMFYETDADDILNLAGEAFYIIPYQPDLLISGRILQLPPNKIFLQTSWSLYQLTQLLDAGYQGGICLMGGDEEATGVRDYGLMDDLIALISH